MVVKPGKHFCEVIICQVVICEVVTWVVDHQIKQKQNTKVAMFHVKHRHRVVTVQFLWCSCFLVTI